MGFEAFVRRLRELGGSKAATVGAFLPATRNLRTGALHSAWPTHVAPRKLVLFQPGQIDHFVPRVMFGFSIPYSERHAMTRTSDSTWVVIYSVAVAVFVLAYTYIPA
jgi:hypothetical protein